VKAGRHNFSWYRRHRTRPCKKRRDGAPRVSKWEAKANSERPGHPPNPQSLNLYAYVENNPTTFGDPDGHGGPETTVADAIEELAAEHPEAVAAALAGIERASTAVGSAVLGTGLRIVGGTSGFLVGAMLNPSTVGQSDANERAAMDQAQHEREQQQEKEPQTSASGAGARQGGGRNAQKDNPDRIESAQNKVKGLRQERDALKSKPNKTSEDKAKLDKLNKAIKRETDRMKKSETHSRKAKGQQ
jgi:hypothetical protein